MRTLSKLRHPCIVTLFGAVLTRQDDPMIVMEHMEQGSLYDLLRNETIILPGENILSIMRDIVQGVRFLHAACPAVVHGGLTSKNILVDSKFHAKVSDFGFSYNKYRGNFSAPYWMAPELLRGESSSTASADTYAFGIVLYELFTRQEPFSGERLENVMPLIVNRSIRKRPSIPHACPVDVQIMMNECWSDDPLRRPTFEEIDQKLTTIDLGNLEFGERNPPSWKSLLKGKKLLEEVFPPSIAEALRNGDTIEPEQRDMATVFFADIVHFTTISQKLSPLKVADMLNRLYLKFDDLSTEHGVYKLETVGDCWVGVSNLVSPQEDHVKRIAEFSVDAVAAAKETLIDSELPEMGHVQIRVGFATGTIVANVIGSRNPRYCIFGDTVNTASRMESNSEAGRIQCTEVSARLLEQQAPYIPIEARGQIEVKGKGLMHTFWIGER